MQTRRQRGKPGYSAAQTNGSTQTQAHTQDCGSSSNQWCHPTRLCCSSGQIRIFRCMQLSHIVFSHPVSNLSQKTTNAVKATKHKRPVNKAIRMGETELREALLDAFTNRYQYWRMSVLKATFNQPEAYLRQELEKVAVLNRSGPHANEWELKPEFKFIQNQALAESAPDAGLDEDEELHLEDVLPGTHI